ncbi:MULTISPECIES: MFS transporter [unclassified Paenibacillus]|uniref:MFS transporter n=1 Tax=unclassified Paenibacillus TaxID=185978 RepID=UPI0009540B48|nr:MULTISPECIES: MFS transporter [unclassified Paenibacillus]ASS64843.1 multidrug efflux MFS transporter [Paenibacillus sp. RUD330]SIR04119.1 Predicted arabinose efflux permease, MFS family [Paenibacillus sp. RU4X]SIR31122.1 Predicted arabinose efflux permease, MFS family [Paenibacillus sp. RU4T]
MEAWMKNLIVLWVTLFLGMAGMTMITPFLPLYLQQDLGISDPHSVALWAGVIFAGNFVTSFLFQPLWGKLSDQYGRKVMLLRSGFGMAFVIVLMGFANHPWQLLALRLLNGTISGMNPAAVSLMGSSAPPERMGFAMGTLQSGGIAGTILGPLIGGLLADAVGYRPIFYITGAMLFTATLLVLFVVRESFDREKAAKVIQPSVLQGMKELSGIPQLMALFTVTLLIQFALMSPSSLMPLYVQELPGTKGNLAFLAGMVTSVTGLSNLVASPVLGRLSDRIGQTKVLAVSLLGAAAMFIPQAFAGSVWDLLIVRFLLGLFLGGLIPSVNALIRVYTPEGKESRAYSLNSSTLALGNMLGPIAGGLLSGVIGIEGIFLLSSVLLFANAYWVWRMLLKPGRKPARLD